MADINLSDHQTSACEAARIHGLENRIAFYANRVISYAPDGQTPSGCHFDHAVRMVADSVEDLAQAEAAQAVAHPRILDCCGGLGGMWPEHLEFCACTCDLYDRTRYGCNVHGSQPRERLVPCGRCQRATAALNAVCDGCWDRQVAA